MTANLSIASVPDTARVTEVAADYAAIARLAWRALVRLGLPLDAVPDAVQDTLLVVHRRWPEFRGQSAVETWVYGIVMRVASDHRKRVRRRHNVIDPNAPLPEHAPSNLATPFDLVADRSAAEVLLRVLDGLPEDLRSVFVLVELEELTVDAAARALGVFPTTCQSRLRSARRLFNAAATRESQRLGRIAGSP